MIETKYDYLIVGAGMFGCVCAHELVKAGYSVLVIEKQNHIGGTCFTKTEEGINVHCYGAHIFRTNSKRIFEYISQFADFNHFINSPIAIVHGKPYNLPFNMNTFAEVWGVKTPSEAQLKIAEEVRAFSNGKDSNLEEHVISLVGKTIYEMFVKGYTEKQWGKRCIDLPSSIINRIPVRFIYDNNYYDCCFQGIPIGGYTQIFRKMLAGSTVLLNADFNANRKKYVDVARETIYSGPIDELLDFRFGPLEYRGLRFEEKKFDCENWQGNAVINYCDYEIPYTRSIEHKHFEFGLQEKTIVSYEYPCSWKPGDYPYYPVNDKKNDDLYKRYLNTLSSLPHMNIGGRLGLYKYFDMQDTISAALALSAKLLRGSSK